MRIVVAGASGMIGRALVATLEARGDDVVRLTRRDGGPNEQRWDPAAARLDVSVLERADAVVDLAGAGIGDRRWTAERRRLILDSRVAATALLARRLADIGGSRTLVNASAIGYYGDTGEATADESSPPGEGFLAEVCQAWEAATAPAATAGIRVVLARSGTVLSPTGGALARQLPLFRLGLGGRLGSGRQWTSWITLRDEVRALLRLLDEGDAEGPVDLVAPNPLRNSELTAALGAALHRPTRFAVPAAALRVALGRQMADALLLCSQRVAPNRLEALGFDFQDPWLAPALTTLLRR